MDSDLSLLQKLAIWALPVLFAITLREVAHAYAARAQGDDTATQMGRLSFNPLRHVDPLGTVVIPALLISLGVFLMGWPKPIPINYSRMRQPRRGIARVALAGLSANLAMAIGWTVLLRIALEAGEGPGLWMGLRYMSIAGVHINLSLFVLNLIPLPPLDAGRVLIGLLPTPQAQSLARIEPYCFFILVALFLLPAFRDLLFWPLVIAQGLLFAAFGIDFSSLL